MAELLTAAQMRRLEQDAIGAGRVSGLELMERAGQGVVDALQAMWPELRCEGGGECGTLGLRPGSSSGSPEGDPPLTRTGGSSPEYLERKEAEGPAGRRAVVLCGPGNNGGDGFVIARLLHGAGWRVSVALLGQVEKLPPDARINHDRWAQIGGVAPFDDRCLGSVVDLPDLVVDAVFGTGLVRVLAPEILHVLGNVEVLRHEFGVKCVSVDLPSGLCSDSGVPLGGAVRADLTVSFHALKLGHQLGQAGGHCGRVVVCDIGLPAAERGSGPVWGIEAPEFEELDKGALGQKYDHGHALVLSGGSGRTGAARLAARAALRVGAGLVTLAVPPQARAEVAAQITAIMLRDLADAGALEDLLWDTRYNALCLGPALGLDARARALVETTLRVGRPSVLDADALTLFRDDPNALFHLLHPDVVLTPHGGEFARLFPDLAAKLKASPVKGPAYSTVDAVRAAARRAGCVVLLKGASTVVAAPDGSCAVHSALYERAAPWLATAGSGDVLAGLICGLIARGLPVMRAAELAAWLHVEAALGIGPGLIAEDLPEQIPEVLRALR